MIIKLFIIGLVVGFIYYEITGISPGGIIAPAYLAMFIHNPLRIAVTLSIAILVFICLKYLSSVTILYGRRRFLLAVILGFFFKLLIDYLIQPNIVIGFDLQSIGFIISGLIANEMYRQKIIPTILSTGIVTLIVVLVSMIVL